ncbi:PREDICTED: arogenate dehydrogenase 1, chloroplastic-like [Fragaria vesca subsp. vesca]|uniref:arogenate dehydrogenase 1, chloroplastic-like n=1 Tax=Fragaria vesca subsp. vesca TaxID=101020 RepID=UPI0002C325B2|nr:PREDICTED: arogenate dehydrogenase 1, chloroplastic-like [Fragaria vesca subsp. vesca]XP_011466938.1 PREDICTED: arogenate dehydrogenase 1, chloroplastic-like [Fragaria vesca subsp. vesca]
MLKIAIIGFGNLGQSLAKTFAHLGHIVLAHSRCEHSKMAQDLGISYFSNPQELCEQNPQVILLCTSIISTESVLKSLPLQSLTHDTLFVDMLPVKEFSKALLLKMLPSNLAVVCTNPMFGVERGKHEWNGSFLVYEKVRIGSDSVGISLCDNFLNIFEKEGCRMVEVSCSVQDKYVAGSQFITHTVGRVLEKLTLESTPINTKGYETLLDLVDNTAGDSFDLYCELFIYNKNAFEMFDRLDLAFNTLKKQLFGHLHDIVRKQLFDSAEKVHAEYMVCNPSHNGAALRSHSQVLNQKAHISEHYDDKSMLKIAIVGFGNFGQFLAKTIIRQGHKVLAYSRSDYYDVAQEMGVIYLSDVEALCEEHPEVMLFCTSILSTEKVLRSFPVQRLMRNTLFVDVLSVKEFPRNLFLQKLPLDFDILCTHPMFGPESGKNGWNALPFVYDKVRVGSDKSRVSLCDRFLDIFALEGCRMVEMSCSEHDRHAAGSQFITHTIGRVLEKLGLESTPILPNGYKALLNLVENTVGDSFDLYHGLFMYNVNAIDQLNRLDMAFNSLKEQFLRRLHGVVHSQHFENASRTLLPNHPENAAPLRR